MSFATLLWYALLVGYTMLTTTVEQGQVNVTIIDLNCFRCFSMTSCW